MDTTPIWLLAVFALIVWPAALLVIRHNIKNAPLLDGDIVKTDDDHWAELAMFMDNAREVDR